MQDLKVPLQFSSMPMLILSMAVSPVVILHLALFANVGISCCNTSLGNVAYSGISCFNTSLGNVGHGGIH